MSLVISLIISYKAGTYFDSIIQVVCLQLTIVYFATPKSYGNIICMPEIRLDV